MAPLVFEVGLAKGIDTHGNLNDVDTDERHIQCLDPGTPYDSIQIESENHSRF